MLRKVPKAGKIPFKRLFIFLLFGKFSVKKSPENINLTFGNLLEIHVAIDLRPQRDFTCYKGFTS